MAYPLLRVSTPSASGSALVPPLNFGHVGPCVFRSGYPQPANYAFLATLQLHTVLYVGDNAPGDGPDGDSYHEWLRAHNVAFVHLPLPPSQDALAALSPDEQQRALERLSAVVDAVAQATAAETPLLVHSDKGKHRVGVAIAAVRQVLDRWALAAVYAEDALYTGRATKAGGKGAAAVIDVAEWV